MGDWLCSNRNLISAFLIRSIYMIEDTSGLIFETPDFETVGHPCVLGVLQGNWQGSGTNVSVLCCR